VPSAWRLTLGIGLRCFEMPLDKTVCLEAERPLLMFVEASWNLKWSKPLRVVRVPVQLLARLWRARIGWLTLLAPVRAPAATPVWEKRILEP